MATEDDMDQKAFEKTVKRGFDPRARLQKRGLRKATITLFLDEDKGVELGWAHDVHDALGNVIGRDREGVVGRLDFLERTLAIADDQHRAEVATWEALADKTGHDEPKPLDTKPADKEIAALIKKRDALTEELNKTSLVIKLQAVPPVIQKDCARRARASLGITEKGIPEERQEEFEIARSAHLMSDMFQSVLDVESGEVNLETTFEDGIAYMDMLPPGQWARLDSKIATVQFTDAISREIEGQEDFS